MREPKHIIPNRGPSSLEESRRLCERADQLIAETRQKLAHFEWFIDSLRRACEPDFFRPLQDAIRAMHGCESRHAASFAVRKVRAEQIVWTGMVEEFALLDHPAAAACYAWCYGEGSRARTFTLLRLPPIDSPQQAVQFFLLAKEQPARGAVMG